MLISMNPATFWPALAYRYTIDLFAESKTHMPCC